MLTLTGPAFQLPYGTLIQVRVTASNNKGTGPGSDLLTKGAKIRTVPRALVAPTRGQSTNEDKVQVDWLPLISA